MGDFVRQIAIGRLGYLLANRKSPYKRTMPLKAYKYIHKTNQS